MSKSQTSLIDNDTSVRLLRRWLSEGTFSAKEIPALVKDICRKGRWRLRIDEQTGQQWEFDRFEDFVSSPLLAGLNTDVETLRRLCGDDIEAIDALDEATQGRQGERTDLVNNVNKVELRERSQRPAGNSRERALRKLRTESEESPEVKDVYERVLAGEISPHRGMVECGFRKIKTPLEQVRALWNKLSKAEKQAFLHEVGYDPR